MARHGLPGRMIVKAGRMRRSRHWCDAVPDGGRDAVVGRGQRPLLSVAAPESRRSGKGCLPCQPDCPELTQSAIDWLAGPLQVTVTPLDKQAILTYQEKSKRWILHLLSDGRYTLHLAGIGPPQVVLQYPADHWSYQAQLGKDGLQIKVDGEAQVDCWFWSDAMSKKVSIVLASLLSVWIAAAHGQDPARRAGGRSGRPVRVVSVAMYDQGWRRRPRRSTAKAGRRHFDPLDRTCKGWESSPRSTTRR